MNKEYKTFEKLKEELGDKFEEFMYKANIELLEKVNQLETNRDEAIEILKENSFGVSYMEVSELLSILERGKE